MILDLKKTVDLMETNTESLWRKENGSRQTAVERLELKNTSI